MRRVRSSPWQGNPFRRRGWGRPAGRPHWRRLVIGTAGERGGRAAGRGRVRAVHNTLLERKSRLRPGQSARPGVSEPSELSILTGFSENPPGSGAWAKSGRGRHGDQPLCELSVWERQTIQVVLSTVLPP